VWVAAGFGAQQLHGGARGLVEVGEVLAGGRVEELEAGDVPRGDVAGAGGAVEHRGVQGPTEEVGAEDVQPAVADERRQVIMPQDWHYRKVDAHRISPRHQGIVTQNSWPSGSAITTQLTSP
jgi:hypothetical protein